MLDSRLREKVRTASDGQPEAAKRELEGGARTPFVSEALDETRSELHAREPLPGEEEDSGVDPEVVSRSNGTVDRTDSEEALTAALEFELRDETVDDARSTRPSCARPSTATGRRVATVPPARCHRPHRRYLDRAPAFEFDGVERHRSERRNTAQARPPALRAAGETRP